MTKIRFINLILILTVSLVLFSCQENEVDKTEIVECIPSDAAMVIKYNEFEIWQKQLENQNFLNKQKDNKIKTFWSLKEWQKLMDVPKSFILSYNIEGKNDLKETLIFKKQDSLYTKIQSKQTYQYDQKNIQTFETDTHSFYLTNLGQNTIISQSKIILENIIRNYNGGIKTSVTIKKLLHVLSDDTPSLVVNTNLFSEVSKKFFNTKFPSTYLSLSDYMGFDLKFDKEKILFSGIVFQPENKIQKWSKFKNVKPENSVVAEVIPNHFINATSLLISDYQKFNSTEKTVDDKPIEDSIWLDISELTDIQLKNGNAKAFVSKNIDQSFKMLMKKSSILKDFGGIKIYQLKENLKFKSEFYGFIKPQKLQYFSVYQDIILCSDQLSIIEDMIIQINNQNVLSQQTNYKNHLESLTGKRHILWITNLTQQNEFLENQAQDDYKNDFKNLNWEEHELLVSQLIVENNFAYFNILQKQTPKTENKTQVEQIVRIKSDKELNTQPQFFKNWRTGQFDVVYQDINNILHLKDTKGNSVWSKTLDSRIVGKISVIDIYQNSRLQLAFATQNKVYILDKNGDYVAPFPINLRDKITQSLSVFDYENNGKYRFVVAMEDNIKMYDKSAKRIDGFEFKKTKTPIAHPIKHVRIGKKDYILAQEESGKLHILSRRGDIRVEIPKDFTHTDNEWFENQKHFVSITNDGELLKIDESGKITKQAKHQINPKFTANANIMVSMFENKLQINSVNAELPYGVYTQPILKRDYVGIADTQTQKIYVLNSRGDILEGFPIFGQKITDIYTMPNGLVLLCLDENNAMLVYEVKFD